MIHVNIDNFLFFLEPAKNQAPPLLTKFEKSFQLSLEMAFLHPANVSLISQMLVAVASGDEHSCHTENVKTTTWYLPLQQSHILFAACLQLLMFDLRDDLPLQGAVSVFV